MKKTIICEILIVIGFIMLLIWCIRSFVLCGQYAEIIDYDASQGIVDQDIINWYHETLTYGLLTLFAAILDFSAIVFVAIFPLPGIKPLVKRVQAKREARANLRAEKAEADKQKRIEELQAELNELKNQK